MPVKQKKGLPHEDTLRASYNFKCTDLEYLQLCNYCKSRSINRQQLMREALHAYTGINFRIPKQRKCDAN